MANDEMLEVHIGRGIGIGYDTPIIDYGRERLVAPLIAHSK